MKKLQSLCIFILLISLIAIPTFAMAADIASETLVYSFESGTEGFTSVSGNRLTISNDNGTLKCESKLVSGSTGWLTKGFDTAIDGAYYDRIRIVARAQGITDNDGVSGNAHRFKIYYEGTNKTSGTTYAQAEARCAVVRFKNLIKDSDGTYYNSDYQEYIVDMTTVSCWSASDITLLRVDPVNMATGTLYIDSITLYNADAEVGDTISQKDFNGDTTFFDNRFCYTSGNPHYLRTAFNAGSNEITATRLINYQSIDRTDYIYMNRTQAEDCYFTVDLSMPSFAHASNFKHKYLKVEGDLKADTLQKVQFIVRDSKSTSGTNYDTSFTVNSDGTITAGSTTTEKIVSAGEEFHLLWALNLSTHLSDIYINGTKVIENMAVNAGATQFNTFVLNLTGADLGDLYIDNFNVTGLVKPIVDGVETKTSVIPDDSNIERFLTGKTAVHTYGNTLFKDGVKTQLSTKGIYDEETEQYYVSADSLNEIFDLSLSDNGTVVSDGVITVTKSGHVTPQGGDSFTLDYAPKTLDGKIYIPIRQFAEGALGKYVFWHETGILIFTDYEFSLDTTDWIYQSKRNNSSSSGATVWNDIDYLNAYLQYVRPDTEKLEQDYKATTGDSDLSQHPRLFHTASEFAQMKEKYDANVDPVFTKAINAFISNADYYIDNPATYKWSDSMRTTIGGELLSIFRAFGYAYYMTGDEKYVNAAARQFELAATFPDFNTAHVLDAGEAAQGLAIGYDWFYNAFNNDQKKLALKVTREHSLDVLASGLYGRLTSASGGASEWRSFKVMNNYNAIVNAGVTLSAIATLEYDTQTALQYIKDSARSVEYTMQMFPPGGGWNEGLGYCQLTLESLIPMVSNLEKNFGSSYNLMDGQGMENIFDYMVASLGIVGSNNMGDNAMGTSFSQETFFYLAKRYDKPAAAYLRWDDIHNRNIGVTFYDVAYYDFDAGSLDKSVLKSLSDMQYIEGMEMYSIRDSYVKDDADTYFSTHFGTTTGYHQHWDCGTFVLDLLGQRWAYDLGSDNYNLQNEQGLEGYEMFRKRAESHNMLVINPTEFTDSVEINIGSDEFAPVVEAKSNEHGGYVYADMSDVYPDASKMLLGYYIEDNTNSVTMRNEFTLTKDSSCIWTMNTKGTVKIDGNVAYVKRGVKTIRLEAICSGTNVTWADNGAPKSLVISDEKFANQNQNTEYTQLRLSFDAASGDHKLIIKISPAYGTIEPIKDIPISQWTLPEGDGITITEIEGMVTATSASDEGYLILAAYDEAGSLSDVEYVENSSKLSLTGDFYAVKGMAVDNFTNLEPLCEAVTYMPRAGENDITNSHIIDFNDNIAGATVKNYSPNVLTISLDSGNLKCDYAYSSGERSYLYLPLDKLDGNHYNKMKIRAKLVSSDKSPQSCRIYYTGTDKLTGDAYVESSKRGTTFSYVNLTENSGLYSNSEYEEYIVNLDTVSKWTDSYITRLRIDGLIDGNGTLYIDEIMLYHEDVPILEDFNSNNAGITSSDNNKLVITLEDEALKCDSIYTSGYSGSMYLPLDNIDGSNYNRLRIKARAQNLSGPNGATKTRFDFGVFYTGIDKYTDVTYGESSNRGQYTQYTGLTENSGLYSNSDYQEYIIDLTSFRENVWSDCYIIRLRFDPLNNAWGTVYIDEIELYYEEVELSSIEVTPDSLEVPLENQNAVLAFVKENIQKVTAKYSDGKTVPVENYTVTINGDVATVTYEGVTDTIALTYEEAPYPASLTVTPETLTIPLENQDDVLSFVKESIENVTVTYSDGTSLAVTDYTVSVSGETATVAYEGVFASIALTFDKEPEPVVFDFEENMTGFSAKNFGSNVLTLSLEGGALKCDYNYVSGERSYLYMTLGAIDGGYYNRMKIRARIASVGTSSQYFRMYFTGTDKTNPSTTYGESSTRYKSFTYTGLTEKDGVYSNADYVEYEIDLSTMESWSDSYVSKIRMDCISNATALLYIDSIELYHAE